MKVNLIYGLIIALRIAPGLAQEPLTAANVITTPPDFIALSYSDANLAVYHAIMEVVVWKIKTVSPEYISNIDNQLIRKDITDDNKALAVYLLGKLAPQDSNTVEVLIGLIDKKILCKDIELRRWDDYPARDALLKIGKSASVPILKHLPGEVGEIRRRLMCEVLKSVEGADAAMDQLKQLRANETDPSKLLNLDKSLEEVNDGDQHNQ